MDRIDIPVPQSVLDWNARMRRVQRRARVAFRAALAPEALTIPAGVDYAVSLFQQALQADAATQVPANVRADWNRYAAAYNAEAHRLNTARQARINAHEVAKVRDAACPRCFATHRGEC